MSAAGSRARLFYTMTPAEKKSPLLSIVVPVLNEEKALAGFLAMLGAQKGITFEVIFADGGSSDNSRSVLRCIGESCPFVVRWLETPRGRALQMNQGAEEARGRYLLFLHVDSRLLHPDALSSAIDFLSHAGNVRCVAGHFRLVFGDAAPEILAHMSYWEIKARLNRRGCTHGDQGMLMERQVFEELGRFPFDLPLFEDTILADSLRAKGQWLLLPAEIETSARRFASEGLRERQLLNALLSNFKDIGWSEYFAAAGPIYRQQAHAGTLVLKPFLLQILSMLSEMPVSARFRLWVSTGRFVRSNAWQLLLALRVRSGHWTLETPTEDVERGLNFFDRWFDLLTSHRAGFALTGFLTWLWFRKQLRREAFRRHSHPS